MVDSNGWEKENKRGEKKGRKEGWTRQKDVCGCTGCFTLQTVPGSSEGLTAYFHPRGENQETFLMQSWEDASSLVFLIFGLNHPADEEMFVASSGSSCVR
ncbi:hypothetical protein ABVT39_023655 [Epinephelus coioides]